MKHKSKFITFLLSFIPGLAHFYLGYPDRGIIYLFLFGGVSIGSIILGIQTGSEFFLLTLIGGTAIIWLIALVDAFSTINKIRYAKELNDEIEFNPDEIRQTNKRIITLSLAVIPGAGHMYLGDQKKGLLYMGVFFISIFFMGWLNLNFLLFLLPLIWFYAFFDAFHTFNGDKVEEIEILNILPGLKAEFIGKTLIGIGILIILQKILYPIIEIYIDYRIKNYIQTSIVALIFIIGGVKMLSNRRDIEVGDEVDGE